MKKSLFALLLLPLILLGSTTDVYPLPDTCLLADSFSSSELVEKAARLEMSAWLQRIPAGQEKLYGFSSRAEFARAEIGAPIQMASISPAAVLEEKDPPGKIELLQTWRVPVTVDGVNRALLTAVRRDEGFDVVGLGASRLASELGAYTSQSIGARGDLLLVRVFQLRSDFLMLGKIRAPEEGTFYPLQSARTYLALGTVVEMSHQDVVEVLGPHFERLQGSL